MNTKTTVISQAELDAQFACCDKIAAYWQTKGRTPTAYVETYGCQQNEADSEKLRGFLAQCGYAIVGSAEGADVVMGLRIQKERQEEGNFPSLREYSEFFGINEERMKYAKPDALIMHPGPINRGVEITSDAADCEQSVINEQVTSGVAVRMALLYLLTRKGVQSV